MNWHGIFEVKDGVFRVGKNVDAILCYMRLKKKLGETNSSRLASGNKDDLGSTTILDGKMTRQELWTVPQVCSNNSFVNLCL